MTRGFTAGAFDLFHPGHIAFLEECKSHCDELIVGLHVDPSRERVTKNKPVETVFERWMRLNACELIDYIVPYETEDDLSNILACMDIQMRFMGSDYQDDLDQITGWDICLDREIEIHFIPRLHNYSSSNLRERLLKTDDVTVSSYASVHMSEPWSDLLDAAAKGVNRRGP